ncbi:hypothetical protein B0189_11090 [Moraxella cuniculi]|uniref:Uncharacterized protein n=1 Tax=Moraxella cuniculi TaxID=34061 RepID=A0A448GUC7_9GAMM|nr:hypothetical protein B0189_11090 [Moraxella cuniculi]VEG12414.1 Uncharacterised protein [Moraxella cuniculi]
MKILSHILKFYLKLILFLISVLLIFYLFISKEKAYYYCNNSCITIIQHTKGTNTFLRVYQGIVFSKNANVFYSYAEYPPETYIYIKNDDNNQKIVIENFTLPVQYKGNLEYIDFRIGPYDNNGLKYTKLRYFYLFI